MNNTLTSNITPSKIDAPSLWDKIRADFKGDNVPYIRPFELRELGYVLNHKAVIKGTQFELWRVLDEDTKKEASFSFLFVRNILKGCVMPNSFSHYTDSDVVTQKGSEI